MIFTRSSTAIALVLAASLAVSRSPAKAGTLALYEIDGAGVRVVEAHTGALLRLFYSQNPATDIAIGKNQNVVIASTHPATGDLIVSEYAPNVDRPFSTIALAPTVGHVAFSDAGELAVTLDCAGNGGGACICPQRNGILFFEDGAHDPSRAVSICGDHYGLGFSKPAYAPDGTLWARSPRSAQDNSRAYIRPGGTTFHQFKLITSEGSLGPPDAVVDAAGNLVSIYPYGRVHVTIWSPRTGKALLRFRIDGLFSGVSRWAVSPDGQNLFISSVDGFVLVYRYPLGGKPVVAYRVGGTGIFALGYV